MEYCLAIIIHISHIYVNGTFVQYTYWLPFWWRKNRAISSRRTSSISVFNSFDMDTFYRCLSSNDHDVALMPHIFAVMITLDSRWDAAFARNKKVGLIIAYYEIENSRKQSQSPSFQNAVLTWGISNAFIHRWNFWLHLMISESVQHSSVEILEITWVYEQQKQTFLSWFSHETTEPWQ